MADDKKMVVMEKRSSTPGISPEVSDHGTKTKFLKSAKEGEMPTFPGDFELQTLTLTSPNREGYIESFSVSEGKKPLLTINLKYFNGQPTIKELKRISRPGLREYVSNKKIPTVKGGLGISVISTNKGLMTDKEAKQAGIGGEVICLVF